MRTYYLTTAAAAALIAGFALSPAQAEVLVTAVIQKDKNVTVDKDVSITKDVFIFADQFLFIERAAESLAIANQSIDDNTVTNGGANNATISASVDGNTGVMQFNNAAGHLNQQGNLVAAAVDAAATGNNAFADAQASAGQVLTHNSYQQAAVVGSGNVASTDNSITNNTGVVHGNNAAGDMNQQLNSLSIALALTTGNQDALALAEADLGQSLSGNLVSPGGAHSAFITGGSLSDNTGIVGYNQASGAMNQQGNVVALSATSGAQALFGQ